jgi:hypothetical protein
MTQNLVAKFLVNNVKLFVVGLIALSAQSVVAQGCSDAGLCTMGTLKPNQFFDNKLRFRLKSIDLNHTLGITPTQDRILQTSLDFNFTFKNSWTAQLKLPYQITQGRLGETQGFGDVTFSMSRVIFNNEKVQVALTLGGKVATGDANQARIDDRPLPLLYQSSLGSNDLIFGGSIRTRNWMFAAGYQRPLNATRNTFMPEMWEDTDKREEAALYFANNQFFRGSDVMMRVERNIRFSRLNIFAGLLSIYRITPDKVMMEHNGVMQNMEIKTSQGFVFTLMTGFGYQFSMKSGIKLLVGKKDFNQFTRGKHIDGLVRNWVYSFSYQYRF